MPPGREPSWRIYKDELEPLGYGDALWEPSPPDDRKPINIGDVGFIRDGRFHLLFSAGSPLGELEPGEDVPATFVPLEVGTPVFGKPREPCCLRTSNVRPLGPLSGTATSTPLLPENEADFAFELTGNRGAALVTRHRTIPEDISIKSQTAFDTYITDHYKSWVDFADSKQCGNDIHLVLVSGFDMTRDFSTMAYSRERDALTSPSSTPTQMFSSTPPDFRGEWRAPFSPDTNDGPRNPSPPSHGTGGAGKYFYRLSQCVFIRYYTMRSRKWFLRRSRLIRNSAGSSVTGFGSDIVQTPSYEEYDNWDAIADYIFRNSKAKCALMHHQDLADIRSMGGSGDIPSILIARRPYFEVDKDGVARINCKGGRELPRTYTYPRLDVSRGGDYPPTSRSPSPTAPMIQRRVSSTPPPEKPKKKCCFCCYC